MANKDTIIAVVSDMQVGSTVALCPPKWNLNDGGTYHASPGQKIIHRQWVKSAKIINDALTEGLGRKRLVLILNGEPVDGDHHGTPQLITKTKQDQIDMAIALLDEWLQVAGYDPKRGDCMYLIRGTTAHESGEVIEQIGRDIDGVVPVRKDSTSLTKDGRYSWEKVRRTVNGVLFHIAHHGFNRGSRAWTTSNSIFHALKSMYFTALDYGYDIPDYVIRSHNHVYTKALFQGRTKMMHGCITPCWQLKTHFGNRVASNEDINTIGMIYYEVLKSGASKHFTEFIEVEDTPVQEF